MPAEEGAAAPAVEIDTVSKHFGSVAALTDLSLSIPAGRFYALLGPSGCGKTTLMRLVAGFETPDAGAIRIAGMDMAGVPAHARPVNMMFQSYALFPHMSVGDNIAFGLRRAGFSRDIVADGVAAMLRLVQLQGMERRKPDQLSGGQRQRVALARALARKPKILLLDEPMAALDRKLREETQFALKDIQRELGTTFLVVTHDQDEAMGLADTIAVMRDGRIEQIGAPPDIYARPASKFVARFIGDTNLIDGTCRSVAAGIAMIETADGPFRVTASAQLREGDAVTLALRPERIAIVPPGGAPDGTGNVVEGRVFDTSFRGAQTILRVQLASGALMRVTRQGGGEIGNDAPVRLAFGADDALILHD
jgi:putrescine transport system ATP-binding protein